MGTDGAVRHPKKASATIPRVLYSGPGTPSMNAAWRGMGEAWTVLSTIIAGIGVWGGVGYGLDLLFSTRPVGFVIGVLVGHFAAIYLVYVRALKAEEGRDAP